MFTSLFKKKKGVVKRGIKFLIFENHRDGFLTYIIPHLNLPKMTACIRLGIFVEFVFLFLLNLRMRRKRNPVDTKCGCDASGRKQALSY